VAAGEFVDAHAHNVELVTAAAVGRMLTPLEGVAQMSSKSKVVNLQRRNMLKVGSLALVAIGAVAGTRRAQAQGKALPLVDPKDPTAATLGYVADASKVDKAKFPKFAAGQQCNNCTLWQGKPTDATAGCSIFPGKAVHAKGWCTAWVKKA
jgi:hypothetical protein